MSGKDQALAKGDRVLVSVRSPAGGLTLQPGQVKEPSGKGAFVHLDSGQRRFFFTTQISLDTTPKLATVTSIAQSPVQKQSAPPHFAPKAAPEPTIGGLFAAERVSRGLSQGVAARELGVKLGELLDFESGAELPGDELVLRFSEAFSVELGPLSDALGRSKPKPPPVAVHPPAPKVEPQPAAVPSVPTTPTKSELGGKLDTEELQAAVAAVALPEVQEVLRKLEPNADHAGTFEDFVERLDTVTPLPARGARRQEWFQLAKALFKLNTETA